jgi:glycosyltransferase involved in cell wall biosynthesis
MITYCYNGERFVSKYFEAVLAQTYSNIELIFFNNGSEDKTGEIAESYREKLNRKGISTKIIHYKENQSTCELKQKGFEMMKGEYFFGCDSDDLIDPTYIEEMSAYLVNNPDKGIVYCQLRVIQEETGKQLSIMKMIPRHEAKKAFEDILLGENINFTAISYMMSRKIFEQINPEKKIYISNYGENYQIQIPFLYKDLQGYIEKPLGSYTVRGDSYTGSLTLEKKIRALKGQEKSVLATFEMLQGNDLEYYKEFFLKRIRRDRFYTALFINDNILVNECYDELKKVKIPTIKERLSYLLFKCGLFPLVKRIKAVSK